MLRDAVAELRPHALQANLERARRAAPASAVFASVKAAGYGHGLIWAAQQLAPNCEGFGVATVGEGLALRDAGFREHRICVFNGPGDRDELAACAAHGLEPAIHQPWHLDSLEAGGFENPLGVWLKIETGMGRLGVPAAQAGHYHARLAALPCVRSTVGMMTHLANADDRHSDYTRQQLDRFRNATVALAGSCSIANSAAVLGWPDAHAEWNRPGIMLYGCSPFIEGARSGMGLEPVMRLSTRLIAVNELEAGASVGYGCTYTCPEDMRVGVAAIGYGDGYPRHAANGTPVSIRGRRVPMIGRVSMDKITVDLRGAPEVCVGDVVELWGDRVAVEEVAGWSGTIGYELLCGVQGRVPMRELSS